MYDITDKNNNVSMLTFRCLIYLLTGLVAVKRIVLEMVYVYRINVPVWMVIQGKVVKLLYVLITAQTKATVWITGANVIKDLQVIITYREEALSLSCLCLSIIRVCTCMCNSL